MTDLITTPETFWNSLREQLLEVIPADTFRVWFDNMRIGRLDDDGCELIAPNEFSAIWIRDNYLDVIRQEADRLVGRPYTVDLLGEMAEDADDNDPNDRLKTKKSKPSNRVAGPALKGRSLGINPKNTFDNFIVGGGSELAHAACIAVSNAPAHAYNPLFLYGETGLGKTHLMHAVGNSIAERPPSLKVAYMYSQRFMEDMVRAIERGKMADFTQYYRTVNVLLMDDIQFLAKGMKTQEEFFHVFNRLQEDGSQIVLTCDRYPKEIEGLEERLESRFVWGMTAPVEPPELETRVAILMKKAELEGVVLPSDTAFFLGERIRSNVRELEGALKRVIANAKFTGREINIEQARDALRDLIAIQDRQVSLENIQKTVADYYKVRVGELNSKRRTRSIARPRQLAMAISKAITTHSLPEIGDSFGGRDHTTVLHACRKIEELRECNSDIREDYNNLLRILTS